MKQRLIKLLTVAIPVLSIASFCTQVQAQNFPPPTQIMQSQRMSRDAASTFRKNWGTVPDRTSGKRAWTSAKTSFTPDAEVTEQTLNAYIGSIQNPKAKKFLALLLTEKSAQRIYKDFHPELNLSFNDVADTFTMASLSAFMTIENRNNISTEQVQGVREQFRNIFANHSRNKAEVQKLTQEMMYWLLLKAYSENKAGSNPEALAKNKADSSSMLKSIGFNPQKYTLGSNGFVVK